MDDDFTFGASVWGTPDPAAPVVKPPSPIPDDDFDDFGSPPQAAQVADDDDFGDFGDFGDAQEIPPSSSGFSDDMAGFAPVAGPSSYGDWDPLKLAPMPGRPELEDDINTILGPLWGSQPISEVTTDDEIREREGINQILVTPESRDLYSVLVQSPPPTKPPNWIRSRIRRQHLIALGIPVNLDEVLPQANGRPLPALHITTRPMSAPPGARNASHAGNATASASNSRAGSPRGNNASQSHFGPKPDLDDVKIQQLLALGSESLTIQPLATLERHLAELRAHTAKTQTRLTHLLQSRDALQQDAETYNGLIAELVGEAQKIKTGKGRTPAPTRRGSGMV
ncbi:hypothetical protein BDZ89DRAFT_938070 [Hymenopellis radicata]|nr:hypothetical protein BDZ89DRAFT_938070 [Hymenopellis radicata]